MANRFSVVWMIGVALALVMTVSGSTPSLAQPESCPSDYSVDFEGTQHNVAYELSDCGSIENVLIDHEFASLVITLGDSGPERELTINLPKSLIDARQGNADSEFLVFVDGVRSDSEELSAEASDERVVVIGLPANSTEVEIVGTQVVPEFPIYFAGIFGALLGGIAILTRLRPTRWN